MYSLGDLYNRQDTSLLFGGERRIRLVSESSMLFGLVNKRKKVVLAVLAKTTHYFHLAPQDGLEPPT